MNKATLGQRIRASRHAAGWTQDELALYIRRERKAISRIETGTSDVTISQLYDIAAALKADLTEWLRE